MCIYLIAQVTLADCLIKLVLASLTRLRRRELLQAPLGRPLRLALVLEPTVFVLVVTIAAAVHLCIIHAPPLVAG